MFDYGKVCPKCNSTELGEGILSGYAIIDDLRAKYSQQVQLSLRPYVHVRTYRRNESKRSRKIRK
jgi:hypothetical protein